MTVQRPSHYNAHCRNSPEGWRKLAGDNIPGHHAPMTPRPGGAPESLSLFKILKVIKGIILKSTLDLGCISWQVSLPPSGRAVVISRENLQPSTFNQQPVVVALPPLRKVMERQAAKPTEPTENRLDSRPCKPFFISRLE
jgi:hypothetical protein